MAPTPIHLDVIIVGAGLAGLTTAWALRSSGHNVTVLEKSARLNVGGADIQIAPNGVRCLDKLGLLRLIQHAATPVSHVEYRNWHSMSVLTRRILNPRQDYGSMLFRRDDLIQVLFELAVREGIKVIFEAQVIQFDDDNPSVKTKTGDVYSADLVIGADGVYSAIRSLMFPNRDTKPIVTDTVCFQFSVPYETLSKDSETLAVWNNHDGVSLQLGDGKYVTSWRNEYQRALFVIFSQRNYGKPVAADDWTRKGDIGEVLELYSDYPTTIQKLIRSMDTCEKWRIVDSVQGADWISSSGTAALIGDAIHAMPPHAAQGFSQGIEDAASLYELLKNLYHKEHVPVRMRAWAGMREPRATMIQTAARATLNSLTLPDGPAQQARDEAFRRNSLSEADITNWKQPILKNLNAIMTEHEFLKWVYLYDVMDEVNKFRSDSF